MEWFYLLLVRLCFFLLFFERFFTLPFLLQLLLDVFDRQLELSR